MGRIRTLRHLRAASPGGLNLDFTSGALDGRITASGGANGTVVNSSGVLVAANAPRFDYNPSTLSALGLLVEEARTNAIRNSTMVGASAGTPGTLPTNWSSGATVDGLARQVVGVGTESGIAYIDVRYSGTVSVGGVGFSVQMEATANTVASSGQTWSLSPYLRLVSGSFAGLASAPQLSIRGYDSGSVQLDNLLSSVLTITGAALGTQRSTFSGQLTNVSTAFVAPHIRLATGAAAQVVDFTLRIGLPQLELGAFATSAIQTSGAAVTRTADSVSMTGTNFSQWFNASAGTFVVQFDVLTTASTQGVFAAGNPALAFASADAIYGAIGAAAKASTNVLQAGVSQAAVASPNTISLGVQTKAAFAYAANSVNVALAGSAGADDTSATMPVPTGLSIGSLAQAWTGAANALNGHIASLRYFPSRLPNASLQSLTA